MVAVVSVAAILRFNRLSARGLIYWDEGKFALEGKRIYAYLSTWLGRPEPLQLGKTVGTAKPTHALLIAISYVISGQSYASPLFLDSVMSVVSVVLLFFVGNRLFGAVTGLVASGFLACSEYDAIYARSALSESDATTFLLLAVLCFLRQQREPRRGWFVASGFLCGLAFTTNYRLAVYVVALIATDVVLWARSHRSLTEGVRRASRWLATAAIAPLLWEAVDVIGYFTGHVLFRSEVNITITFAGVHLFRGAQEGQPEPYLLQALFQLHGGATGVAFGPAAYGQWLIARQGWVFVLLVITGAVTAVRLRRREWLVPLVMAFVPTAIYCLAPFTVPRNLQAAIPFECLLAAAALTRAIGVMRQRNVALATAAALGIAVAAFGVHQSVQLWHEESGLAKAAQFIRGHGGRAVGDDEVLLAYLPGPRGSTRCSVAPVPRHSTMLSTLASAGYRYAVLEFKSRPEETYLERHEQLVRTYSALGDLHIGENLISSENGHPPGDSGPVDVRVYRLRRGLGAPPDGQCNRNVPIHLPG
jgi:4-amino-4-deoxy-L-arabinose transferase-like glycosyltransferase